MAQLFYGKLGLPIKVRNILKEGDESARSQFDLEGAPSTNEIAIRTWLAELDKEDWKYKVLDGILTMKGVRQRRSLYYKPYRLWKSPQDGRIHPQFKNCGTVTRRPSGTSPNILQVSKTKDDGRMRSTFLPQNDDELVVSIDFVQQELVILAALSQDVNLLSCYVGDERKDVHSMTACAIMNMLAKKDRKPEIDYARYIELYESGDKEAFNIRKKYAKTTNFLIVYGGSADGLSRKTIVPRAMAEQFVDGFHKTYPAVEKYQEKVIRFARKHGYVNTVFGNRKHCDGIFDKNDGIASSWERQAVNYTIQGLAADIAKIVAREYYMRQIEQRFGATIYAIIYDEVVASVPKANIAAYVEEMADIMEMEIVPGVRLRTSVSIGKNFGDQVEIGERPTAEAVNEAIYELEKEAA
jgi:DNA polymerase I-like protein with 3'-5' exonuclease and polymerase domains